MSHDPTAVPAEAIPVLAANEQLRAEVARLRSELEASQARVTALEGALREAVAAWCVEADSQHRHSERLHLQGQPWVARIRRAEARVHRDCAERVSVALAGSREETRS